MPNEAWCTWPLWSASSDCPVTSQTSAGDHILQVEWKAHHRPQQDACAGRVLNRCAGEKLQKTNMLETEGGHFTETPERRQSPERTMTRWPLVWTDMWYFKRAGLFFFFFWKRIVCKSWRTPVDVPARLCCCALGVAVGIDRSSGAKRTVCSTLSPRSLQTPATSTKVKENHSVLRQLNTGYNFIIKVYYCYNSTHTLSDKTRFSWLRVRPCADWSC